MKYAFRIAFVMILLALCIVGADVLGVGSSDEPIQLSITEQDNLSTLSQQLAENNIVISKHLFKLFYQWNTHSSVIHPGTITVHKQDSYQEIADTIQKPLADTVTITIPEGFEVYAIASRLQKNELIQSEEEFYSALEQFSFETNQGKKISGDEVSGFLFPDTYSISQKATPTEIIQIMTDNFKQKWTDAYQKKADKMNMSITDVINLASIVEREARKDEDFPLVASVFHNRLKKNQKLESCATVQYILRERKTVLSFADTKIDSPYNTYQYSGLPPTAISSPGIMAIEAVLYPEETDYLYFFTDKNGDNHYAKTFAEHNALIQQFGL